jgi:hypothetical protein
MKISATVDRWLSRVSGIYSFWPLLPTGAAAVVSGLLSRQIGWIAQYGAFGWWSAALCGFTIAAAGLLFAVKIWEVVQNANAAREWARRVDSVNPLRTAFVDERISIRDLAHPINHRIKGKTFTNCELIGPDNMVFMNDCSLKCGFMNCDFVIVEDNAYVHNVKVFDSCNVIGGTIWNCSVFLPQSVFETIRHTPNINCITYEKPK